MHTCLFHPGTYNLTVSYEPYGIHACRSFHKAGPLSVEIKVLPRASSPEPLRMAKSPQKRRENINDVGGVDVGGGIDIADNDT